MLSSSFSKSLLISLIGAVVRSVDPGRSAFGAHPTTYQPWISYFSECLSFLFCEMWTKIGPHREKRGRDLMS